MDNRLAHTKHRRGMVSIGGVVMTGAVVTMVAVSAHTLVNAAGQESRVDQAVRSGWSPYAIGMWGDLPYSPLQETVGVPNLIADLNAHRLAFTVHDGDLKQGSNSLCDAALYERSLHHFNSLEAPAMFTPGDNDWTDCDRPNNGGYWSLERLEYERHVFFSTPYSLGQRQLPQEVQSALLCLGTTGFVPCVENRRWTFRGVTFATLNIQGSCNNLCDTDPDPAEYEARNEAVIQWMREAFAAAETEGSAAVMLISQANPG